MILKRNLSRPTVGYKTIRYKAFTVLVLKNRYFISFHGLYHGFSNSIPDSVDSQYLKEQLKHTWEWIWTLVATHRLNAITESHGSSLLVTGDCFEAGILFMKTRAFVDGLLFERFIEYARNLVAGYATYFRDSSRSKMSCDCQCFGFTCQ